MHRFSFVLVACLVVTLAMPAAAELVWVLGSYAMRDNAEAERVRLSELLGVEVSIVPYKAKQTWRVVARKQDIARQTLARQEVEGWLANLDLVPDEPPARPQPPIAPNESLWDYCERLGNAPDYCASEALQELLQLRQRLRASVEQLSLDCERATRQAHKEICQQWQASLHVAPGRALAADSSDEQSLRRE